MFKDFKFLKKAEQIQHDGLIFVLIGIPIITVFAALDESAIGLKGTLIWRLSGLIPMTVFVIYQTVSKITRRPANPAACQFLITLVITGISVMMSGIMLLALKNISELDTVGLAGTIGGNLAGIFVIILLHGAHPLLASAGIILPYSAMSLLLVFQKDVTSGQWVYVGNLFAAIIVVIIAIWQNEKSDNDRLRMLYNLQQEHVSLEKAVADRTKELEVLIQELHHRVRNNLQIILSVISLYENEYPGDSHDKRLKMIQKVIFIIEYTHHMTHYDQIEEKVGMASFLDEICTYSYAPDEFVLIEKEIEDIQIDTDIAVIIGFICVHLISHAGTHCCLSFSSEEDGVSLTFTLDEGIQIPAEDSRIVNLLADHIYGKIVLSKTDENLIFKIQVPLER